MLLKRFLEWISVKSRLHYGNQKPPLVSEGEIWWASLGENIGREINGKDSSFTRPVFIFKKLATDFYHIIPLTSQIHHGSWYVEYVHEGVIGIACLHQARSIDYRRIHRKMGKLENMNIEKIRKGFAELYI